MLLGLLGYAIFYAVFHAVGAEESFYGFGNTIAGEVAASEIRDVLVGETTRDGAIPDGGLGATQLAYIVSGTEGMFKLNRTLLFSACRDTAESNPAMTNVTILLIDVMFDGKFVDRFCRIEHIVTQGDVLLRKTIGGTGTRVLHVGSKAELIGAGIGYPGVGFSRSLPTRRPFT